MANKNRTEVSAAIQAQAAIVGETEYKLNLDDNFAQSVLFRKDVSASDTATGATKTLDFDDVDYIEVTQTAVTCTYTLSNIQQGEIKYLRVIKTAGYEVLFATTTDVSPDLATMTAQSGILYQITNKTGSNYARAISEDIVESTTTKKGIVEKATTAEALAGTADKNITADILPEVYGDILKTKIIQIGNWDMVTDAGKIITHGLADHTKIRSIDAMIIQDTSSGTLILQLDSFTAVQNGTVSFASTTEILLLRTTGGVFDAIEYDQTPFNRGWATIRYEP